MEEKKRELGFSLIETRKPYAPLLLDCLVTGNCKREYLYQTPTEGKINLNDVQVVKLWVMCGRYWLYGRRFFFRTENCSSLFVEKNDNLRFVFDAEKFFEMYRTASKENSKAFFERGIVLNKEEIVKFNDLIKTNFSQLSSRERVRAKAWLTLLK